MVHLVHILYILYTLFSWSRVRVRICWAQFRLVPVDLALSNAINESEKTFPLVKFVQPKKRESEPQPVSSVPDQEQLLGYSFAMVSRKVMMEHAGMQTSLPILSKDQKKAEKDRKKSLLNAKHLLR